MYDNIEPTFEIHVAGYQYLGRGPKVLGDPSGRWMRDSDIFYRCTNCGSFMPASTEEYYHCLCRAMSLDADVGRFGSTYGDHNIFVYRQVK